MTELRFIGVEDGCLIVSGDDGRQQRVRIDDALREAVRPRPAARREAPKVPPRQIQQLIRAGRSVEEVVELTGADAEDVARFEAPIRAERDYLVRQARAVPVRVRDELDPLGEEGASFGEALDERLETLDATQVRWDAWRDPEEGWRISLAFHVEELEREAVWGFDPKTRTLSPANPAAITLSQQGELSSLGAPRLRAVDAPGEHAAPVERSTSSSERHPAPAPAPRQPAPLPDGLDRFAETADLLEALRRRRGEREPISLDEDALEAELDDGFAGPSVPQPHRPPVALSGRRQSAPDDADADPGDGDGGDDALSDEDRSRDGHAAAPKRGSGLTGGVDRIRRGSAGRGRDERGSAGDASGPLVVDLELEFMDGLEERAADTPEPSAAAPSRRERAAAERAARRDGDAAPGAGASGDPADAPDGAGAATEIQTPPAEQRTTGSLGRRRSRAAMPSWDEIVFGTKRDGDR